MNVLIAIALVFSFVANFLVIKQCDNLIRAFNQLTAVLGAFGVNSNEASTDLPKH